MVLEAHGGVCGGAVCAVSLRTEPGSARASRRGRRSELSLEAWLGSGKWRETAAGRVFQGEGTALSMELEGRGRGGSGGVGRVGREGEGEGEGKIQMTYWVTGTGWKGDILL